MSLPPEKMPEGLSAREYRRLGIQYLLMGKSDMATEAFSMGYESPGQCDGDGCEPDEQSARGYQQGMKFGADLTNAVMKLLQQQSGNKSCGKNSDECLSEIREQLGVLGVPEDRISKFIDELVEVVSVGGSSEPPPREVPTNLAPREFYELGVHYKELGWTEQARDALTYAIEGDTEGEWGLKAKQFLMARLPRHPVPLMAEQRNISGYNLMMEGDMAGAKEVFEQLIREYPDFEWPYGNLGFLYLGDGNIKEAIQILKSALSLNPNYLNGWMHLARVRALDEDYEAAYRCLARAGEILPDNKDAEKLLEFIKELEKS